MAYGKPKITGQMPVEHYEADRDWLSQQLGYLPSSDSNPEKDERGKICRAYSSAFVEASDLELTDHKKTNAGRFAANTRLRKYMKKRFAVFNR